MRYGVMACGIVWDGWRGCRVSPGSWNQCTEMGKRVELPVRAVKKTYFLRQVHTSFFFFFFEMHSLLNIRTPWRCIPVLQVVGLHPFTS